MNCRNDGKHGQITMRFASTLLQRDGSARAVWGKIQRVYIPPELGPSELVREIGHREEGYERCETKNTGDDGPGDMVSLWRLRVYML